MMPASGARLLAALLNASAAPVLRNDARASRTLAKGMACDLRSQRVEPHGLADLIIALRFIWPDTPIAPADEIPVEIELADLRSAGLVVPRPLDAVDDPVADAGLRLRTNHSPEIMAVG